MMDILKKIKIVSKDGREYIVVTSTKIDGDLYALLTNLKDESDSIYAKLKLNVDNISYEQINDAGKIAKIIASFAE